MKSRNKVAFVCTNCGSSFASWLGRCPDCGEWNTITEYKEAAASGEVGSNEVASFAPLKTVLKDEVHPGKRPSGYQELDRVLGGGFAEDQVVLISGEPGVGKSTLLLSVLGHQKKTADSLRSVYISSEEEPRQLSKRAERLNVDTGAIYFSGAKSVEALLSGLEEVVKKEKTGLVIFDSLQGMYLSGNTGLPGSMNQSKEVLLRIVEFAKKHKVTAIVVGHITKEGDIAGPKFLEHMVDTVLFLEGERMGSLRIVRAFKNRYGPTDEVGFFEMGAEGMAEVVNPSAFFLDWEGKAVGKASIGVRQGVRVVFATVESLVVATSLAFPKRVAKGMDGKRLELILAILKKYLKLPVDKFDIYVNVSGGLRVDDPLADLGLAAAVFSSLTNKVFSPRNLFLGEVGLLGNIRPASALSRINKEARRLGFIKVYSSQNIRDITGLKQLSD